MNPVLVGQDKTVEEKIGDMDKRVGEYGVEIAELYAEFGRLESQGVQADDAAEAARQGKLAKLLERWEQVEAELLKLYRDLQGMPSDSEVAIELGKRIRVLEVGSGTYGGKAATARAAQAAATARAAKAKATKGAAGTPTAPFGPKPPSAPGGFWVMTSAGWAWHPTGAGGSIPVGAGGVAPATTPAATPPPGPALDPFGPKPPPIPGGFWVMTPAGWAWHPEGAGGSIPIE